MCHVEIIWQKTYPTSTLDMKQPNTQRYSIMNKYLLSNLELEELSRLAELNDIGQEELEDMSDSLAETPNGLVDEPPRSAESLPTGIQTFRTAISMTIHFLVFFFLTKMIPGFLTSTHPL